eukprot:TRINITY_DN3026_c0_g1_i1.p1 TRINITY_DN3026_c0_g1~~TRINITY_DN3026_c0_g1_i1.p1  ORF type:complete len:429 (-),score=52.77 TRINITY_DN3026_c0_g1_i1:158-1264(-)
MAVPDKLRGSKIALYVALADRLQSREAVVAHWCRMHSIAKGLKEGVADDPSCGTFLEELMKRCEADNNQLQPSNDAVRNQQSVIDFARRLFDSADDKERQNIGTREVACLFLDAGLLFEVATYFGELDADTEQKRKYAFAKAVAIQSAIKQGVPYQRAEDAPIERAGGGMATDGAGDGSAPSGDGSYGGLGPGGMPSGAPGGFGGGSGSVGDGTGAASSFGGGAPTPSAYSPPPPAAGGNYNSPGGAGGWGQAQPQQIPPQQQHQMQPPPSQPQGEAQYQPSTRPPQPPAAPPAQSYGPSQAVMLASARGVAPNGFRPEVQNLCDAGRMTRFALHSINSVDVPSAVDQLQKALAILTGNAPPQSPNFR